MFSLPTAMPRASAAIAACVLATATPCTAAAKDPVARFISVPDFLNFDMPFDDPRVMDLTNAEQAALVTQINSQPNSGQALINPNVGSFVGTIENGYRGASQVLLEAVAAENADALLIAGDIAFGRWSNNKLDPDNSLANRQQHVLNQASLYYGGVAQNIQTYAGINPSNLFTVVGDHEMGDLSGNGGPYQGSDQLTLMPTYQQAYQAELGRTSTYGNAPAVPAGYTGRVYAEQRANTLVVGIDQYTTLDSSNNATTDPSQIVKVEKDVSGAQLAWLDQTLYAARNDSTIEHIVVMGHMPIVDNGVNVGFSSGLTNKTDENGALWQTLATHNVDLYLPGEVHAISSQFADGVMQVVTGTNVFQPTGQNGKNNAGSDPNNPSTLSEQNYMVVDLYGDRIELTVKQIDTVIFGTADTANDPQNFDSYKAREARVTTADAAAGFQTIGTMTIDKSGVGTVYSHLSGVFVSELTALDPLPMPFEALTFDANALTQSPSPTMPGHTALTTAGVAVGGVTITLESNGTIDDRSRDALAPTQTESDLARDFVFGVRSEGADYLDIIITGLTAGEYAFEGVFHDVDRTQSTSVDLDVDTGAGLLDAADGFTSFGIDPAELSRLGFVFNANGADPVRVRITTGAFTHLINGFELTLVPEPTSLLLMGVGGMLMLGRTRR